MSAFVRRHIEMGVKFRGRASFTPFLFTLSKGNQRS